MTDPFQTHQQSLESPATLLEEIVPSDSADLAKPSRALNVSGAGTIRVTTTGGSTATVFVAAGIPFPVRATRIWATGTSAEGIVSLC